MSYENKSIFTSGSLTFHNRAVRHVTLVSQQITNATTGTYDLLPEGHEMGNFVPTEISFHYVAAAGTAVTSTSYHMGYTGSFNQFINSGSNGVGATNLTFNANSTNTANVQQTLRSPTGSLPVPNGSPLRITITRTGTNTLTGSFIVQGFFMDF